MIKFCPNCFQNHVTQLGCYNGYYWCLKDEVGTCWIDGCNHELINIDFPASDLKILTEISDNPSLYEAMINLHGKDIIEYELKMSQFRNQVEYQKQQVREQQESNVPKCPHCSSTNIKPITGTERAVSVIGLGLFSKKINKSFKCLDCKYTW